MKSASEILVKEHTTILLSLNILNEICNRIMDGIDVPVEDIIWLLNFQKIFSDRNHHGKEEGIFYPTLERSGISIERSPIAVMLTDHDMGRGFVNQMLDYLNKSPLNKSEFIKLAHGYIATLKWHIEKENNILYPLGDKFLSKKKQKELFESFEYFDLNVMGREKMAELRDKLIDLKKKYLK